MTRESYKFHIHIFADLFLQCQERDKIYIQTIIIVKSCLNNFQNLYFIPKELKVVLRAEEISLELLSFQIRIYLVSL